MDPTTTTKSKREKLISESHGGYMSEKIRKLEEQFRSDAPTNQQKAGTSSNIFAGVSIHVNGYTDPSSDELKRLMTLHGGMYIHYYSVTKVTHIIATNLPYAKLRQLRNEKIVKPEWITESVKAGHLLPTFEFELYKDRTSGQNQSLLKLTKVAGHSESYHGNSSANQSAVCKWPEDERMEENQLEIQPQDGVQDVALIAGEVKNGPQEQRRVTAGIAKAGDPNFLAEFYGNSRLHHISTWGAEWKAYVNELHSRGDRTFPGRQRLMERLRNKKDGKADGSSGATGQDGGKTEGGTEGGGEEEGEEFLSWDERVADDNTSGRVNKEEKKEKVIMHIDMDCFFVSVGLVNRPDLIGKPVAVTHSKGQGGMSDASKEVREYERAFYEKKYGSGRTDKDTSKQDEGPHKRTMDDGQNEEMDHSGRKEQRTGEGNKPKENFHSMAEIASCNYEARKAGVKNGMFMGRARSLCPELQTIPYNFEGYKEVSQALYDTVASYTHDIEAVSCDEMFVDISAILKQTGATPSECAKILRDEIREKTRCNASAGMASNILLARMATRVAKPNGQYLLEGHAIENFIKTQPIKDLPGVGWSMARKMENLNVKTCGDLQGLSLGALQREFGPKSGQSLYRFCRGVDDRPIRSEQERKSVSAEINYGIRFKQETDADRFITELATEVHKRLTGIRMQAKTITIKLKVRHPDAPKETSKFLGHGICEDKARSMTLGQGTDDLLVIQRESKKLLKEMQVPAVDMRGVGIQLSKLTSKNQLGGTSSITSFLTKGKAAISPTDETIPHQTTEGDILPKSASDRPMKSKTGAKKGARTMLNFVSKPSTTGHGENGATAHEDGSHDDGVDAKAAMPRKKQREFPPLPFMPSLDGTKRDFAPELALPSPSQIDMSVVAALPKDIQEQILGTFGKKDEIQGGGASDCMPSTSSGITDSSRWDKDVLRALPSHILQEVIQSNRQQPGQGQRTTSEVDTSLGVVEALPSFSQVDPSCLEALPPDLQAELRAAYGGKQTAAPEQEQQPPEQQRAADRGTRSPSTKQSPTKSPFKIRKRGRPKKGSPRAKANILAKPSWQMGIQELITKNQTPPKLPQGTTRDVESPSPSNRIPRDEMDEADRGYWKEEEEGEEKRVGMHKKEEKEEEVVNLCGAVSLWEVKALLKEWMTSTEDPVEEDVGFIVQYLRELILDKNLERVSLVLRSFKRLTSRNASPPWIEAHGTVESRIQHTIEQIYGAQLKLSL